MYGIFSYFAGFGLASNSYFQTIRGMNRSHIQMLFGDLQHVFEDVNCTVQYKEAE